MGKPEIRFKGFTDDWEQRKWIDTVDISTEMVDPTSGEYDDMPHIAPGNIESFTGRLLDNVKTVKEEQLISGKFRFRPDDVVYGKINPQLGKYFYARVDGLTSADAYVFKGKNGTTQKFLFSLLQTRDFFKYSVSVSKRSGMPKINRDELNAYIFLEPSEEEQDKIGSFLLNIDYLITLHQRKCDEVKTLKKYMLQKMFPQNGINVPEIRFSGFTDVWEQRKFGELVEKYEDPVETPTEGYMRLGIRSHAKGTFHSYVEKGKELEAAKMFRVAADKFIVNITFGWEHAVAITDENDAGKLVSHRFPQYSFIEGMIPKFFRYLILDENFKHHLELSSPGGAGRNRVLKLSDMLEYKMSYPGSEEQKKIAKFFDNLDHLITLHQRKCDELRKMKKFMLQNMFPKD